MKLESAITVAFDTKAVSQTGSFSGYASVFNVVDLGGDVVLPGAFTKSLARRPAEQIKLFRNHDQSEPIGVPTNVIEDSKGLKFSGQLILDTVKGRETHALMLAGALNGMSIGFKTLKDRFDRKSNLRYLEELDLYEASIVSFPMNEQSTVDAVKSGDPDAARAFLISIKRLTERLTA